MLGLPVVERRWLGPRYEAARRSHAALLPVLEAPENRIVDELERDGLSLSSLDELEVPGTPEFLAAASQVASELARCAESSSVRGTHTLTADAELLREHPEIFRWGLDERLLRVVEGYLGLPVAYDGLSFYYSIADNREAGPAAGTAIAKTTV